jgi:hypothetical protein
LIFTSLQACSHQWAKQYVPIEENEWICIDGKAIKSAVSDSHGSYQNFVCQVSLFSQKREQILFAERFDSKEKSEDQPALLKAVKDTVGKFDAASQFSVTGKNRGHKETRLIRVFNWKDILPENRMTVNMMIPLSDGRHNLNFAGFKVSPFSSNNRN